MEVGSSFFVFFKQKTAYEMRISDWSSDVCSSDLYAAMINELVLRTQSQAVYAPENIGHFGLALRRYAHFTSPIRRYADLLVHRALIGALDLPGEIGRAHV